MCFVKFANRICNERTTLNCNYQNKIETVCVFPCKNDSERKAIRKDPDQTAPSEKVIAFICFNL